MRLRIMIGVALATMHVAGSVHAGTTTVSYTTPGIVEFAPPSGVTRITFDAFGARGADGPSELGGGAGGSGGRTTGTLTLPPGQVVQIRVGGRGSGISGGFGGGATGGGSYTARYGGGGGGASDVRTGAFALSDRILVAAGGGGGGAYLCGGTGGSGGGSTGGTGGDGTAISTPPRGGTGGSQSQGGTGGAYGETNTPEASGQDGYWGNGGDGGGGYYSGGGGGGGGYYGGGGGGHGYCGAGGGGGSGFGPDGVVFATNTESNDGKVVVSYSQPDVTVDRAAGQADSTTDSPIHFTVVFSEPAPAFTSDAVTLGGTALPTTAVVTEIAPFDGTTFDVAVSGMSAEGSVEASVTAGAVAGAGGNLNLQSTSTDNQVSFYIPPRATVDAAAGQADPTNASPIHFTAVFSEPVTGLVNGDIAVSGTAGATTAVVSELAPYDGTRFDIAVSGMLRDGSVTATIPAGAAEDDGHRGNVASTSTNGSVQFDAAPTVQIEQSGGQADPTLASPIHFTAVFSEPVSGFDGSDVTLGGTAGATAAIVTAIAPNDGTAYDVRVTGMTADGTVIATVPANRAVDAGANGNVASTSADATVTFGIAPTATIDQAAGQVDPAAAGPIHFTVVFSEPVTDFTGSDVSLGGTASATTAVVSAVAPNDGTTYDVAVSGMSLSGGVTASVAAGAALDAAGNASVASTSTDNTVTYVSPNLCGNPGFESNALGWVAFGAGVTLARVSGDAHSGTWALRAKGASASVFGIDDSPDWVLPVSGAGAAYRFSAWVKSGDNNRKARLQVLELTSGGQQVGPAVTSNEVSLSATWTALSAVIVAQQAGSSLSVRITETSENSNRSFLVDDVVIERLKTYSIVASATAGGTITPAGAQAVVEGGSQAFTIAATAGYHLDDVRVDNASVGAVTSYTFTNVIANRTIEARFAVNTAGTNLVGNPGFESDLSGWTASGNKVTLTRVPGSSVGGAHGGSYCLRIASTTSATFGIDDRPDWVSPVAGVGVTYLVKAWVKSLDNPGPATLRLYEVAPNGSTQGSRISTAVNLSATWTLLSATLTTQRATNSLSVQIVENTSGSNRSFLVDDISIEVVPAAAVTFEHPVERAGDAQLVAFSAHVLPNPARGPATLRLATTRAGALRVRLFDITGRVVQTLLDEETAAPGLHAFALTGRGGARVEPGIYFYRVDAAEGSLRGRWVLLE